MLYRTAESFSASLLKNKTSKKNKNKNKQVNNSRKKTQLLQDYFWLSL